METPLDRYIRTHSTPQGEALEWIEKQTNIRTNYPRMLSGAVQGRFLTMLVELTHASRILEIGTFTGYSATCMAYGLPQDGHIDALEINDELEDLIREGWERAGISDKIELHIGDARATLKSLDGPFDFIYIDANKREYCEYFDLLFDKVVPGGLILVDDVLWDGKVYADPVPQDKQTVGITAFNDMVANDPRVETVILPIRDGLTLIRKK
ncbi:MAG: class I SAM-dependent methyltransferase [Bacteroidales bacterium]|nr:class I SAM-dependent methyltransferase [Bacteroidales bacterium]